MRVLGDWGIVVVEGTPHERVGALAGRQRGHVTHQQLLAAGLTRASIRTMVSQGSMIPVHRGVYVVGHLAPVSLGREAASLLACGEHAILSHTSAASIWELPPWQLAGAYVELTLVSGRWSRKRSGIRAHRSAIITPKDVRIHDRLPVTSPARTLLDVAGLPASTRRDVERALDEALARRIVSLTKIAELLERSAGHPGHGILSALVAQRGPSTVTRSQAEERMLGLIRAADLPAPELNVRLLGFTVDFFWREQRVALEVDGYAWHSSHSAFERDRRKANALTDAGVPLIRATWDQMNSEPFAIVARLAQMLANATARNAPIG